MNTNAVILLGTAIVFGLPIGIGFLLARFGDAAVGVVGGIVTFVAIIAIGQHRIGYMVRMIKQGEEHEPKDDTEADE